MRPKNNGLSYERTITDCTLKLPIWTRTLCLNGEVVFHSRSKINKLVPNQNIGAVATPTWCFTSYSTPTPRVQTSPHLLPVNCALVLAAARSVNQSGRSFRSVHLKAGFNSGGESAVYWRSCTHTPWWYLISLFLVKSSPCVVKCVRGWNKSRKGKPFLVTGSTFPALKEGLEIMNHPSSSGLDLTVTTTLL